MTRRVVERLLNPYWRGLTRMVKENGLSKSSIDKPIFKRIHDTSSVLSVEHLNYLPQVRQSFHKLHLDVSFKNNLSHPYFFRNSSLFEVKQSSPRHLLLEYKSNPEEKKSFFNQELDESILGTEAIIKLIEQYSCFIFLVHPKPVSSIHLAIHQIRLLANNNQNTRPNYFFWSNADYVLPNIVFKNHNFLGDNFSTNSEECHKKNFLINNDDMIIDNKSHIIYNNLGKKLYNIHPFMSLEKNTYGYKDLLSIECRVE